MLLVVAPFVTFSVSNYYLMRSGEERQLRGWGDGLSPGQFGFDQSLLVSVWPPTEVTTVLWKTALSLQIKVTEHLNMGVCTVQC